MGSGAIPANEMDVGCTAYLETKDIATRNSGEYCHKLRAKNINSLTITLVIRS